jgi:hypothetical protein
LLQAIATSTRAGDQRGPRRNRAGHLLDERCFEQVGDEPFRRTEAQDFLRAGDGLRVRRLEHDLVPDEHQPGQATLAGE